jgi:hypothetical protein
MAGVAGLEPAPKVLETSMLTIDTIPLYRSQISDLKSEIGLLILSMHTMAAATTAKLFKLKPVRRVLFVFRRHVIALFALGALQNYVISRHKSSIPRPLTQFRHRLFFRLRG